MKAEKARDDPAFCGLPQLVPAAGGSALRQIFREAVRKMTVFEKKTNKFVEEKACQFGKSVVT